MGSGTTSMREPSSRRMPSSRSRFSSSTPVIRIGGILFAAKHHGARVDEAAEIVHVAVRVVPGDAAPQPQDVAHAQILAQSGFQFRPAQARDCAPGSLYPAGILPCSKASLAVHIDAAAFQHDRDFPPAPEARDSLSACAARSGRASSLCHSGYLAQALKRKRMMATSAAASRGRERALQKDRAGIARPAAVGGEAEKFARGRDRLPRVKSTPARALFVGSRIRR